MDGRCILLTFALHCLTLQVCDGQELIDARPVDSPAQPGGILVLVDGKVLSGRFLPRPDGYDVQVPGGRLFVEADRVRFVARDLPDAYLRMRASFAELTPEIHMELARWCLANKLSGEARREVLDALHLDPNRADAKRLLESLVRSDSATVSDVPARSGVTEYPAGNQMRTIQVEARSLAGLSRSVAQDFTRHIQPLLMNKCANSGCHGGKTVSSFQLASAHRGSSPAIAEKNLAAVLKQVDLSRPSGSPILMVLDRPHGNLPVPLFRGRAGSQQMRVLRNWVLAVANDISPQNAPEQSDVGAEIRLTSGSAREAVNEPNSSQSIDDAFTDTDTHAEATMVPHGRLVSTSETDQVFLREASRVNVRDAFDPSEFNRRFHGSPRKSSAQTESSKPGAVSGFTEEESVE